MCPQECPSVAEILAEAEAKAQAPMPWEAQRYVYFAKLSSRLIKIGVSSNPKVRLRSLQRGKPCRLQLVATFPGSFAAEKAVHAAFAQDRVEGEWFRPSDVLHELIDLIIAKYGA